MFMLSHVVYWVWDVHRAFMIHKPQRLPVRNVGDG